MRILHFGKGVALAGSSRHHAFVGNPHTRGPRGQPVARDKGQGEGGESMATSSRRWSKVIGQYMIDLPSDLANMVSQCSEESVSPQPDKCTLSDIRDEVLFKNTSTMNYMIVV